MLQPVPTLSLDGWVYTPKEKLDNLFVHFAEANYSQTTLARGSAYSFPYIVSTNRDKPEALREELVGALNNYFGGYFASVDAAVTIVNDPNVGDALILNIFLEVKDEKGVVYNLAKISSDLRLKTVKWANLNNTGDENSYV